MVRRPVRKPSFAKADPDPAARAEGRVGGRRPKLDAARRRAIAESVITGRKTGAEMARLFGISQPTVSRIVARHRTAEAP